MVDYQIAQVDLAVATGTLLGASKIEWAPIDPRDAFVGAEPTRPSIIDPDGGTDPRDLADTPAPADG